MEACLLARFHKRVSETPDDIAAVFDSTKFRMRMSFLQLANLVADAVDELRDLCDPPGTPVALCFRSPAHFVAALLACLETGTPCCKLLSNRCQC